MEGLSMKIAKINSIKILKQADAHQGRLLSLMVSRVSKAIFMYERFSRDAQEQQSYRETAIKTLNQMKNITDNTVTIQKIDTLISLLEQGSTNNLSSYSQDLASHLRMQGAGKPITTIDNMEGKVKDPSKNMVARIKAIKIIRHN